MTLVPPLFIRSSCIYIYITIFLMVCFIQLWITWSKFEPPKLIRIKEEYLMKSFHLFEDRLQCSWICFWEKGNIAFLSANICMHWLNLYGSLKFRKFLAKCFPQWALLLLICHQFLNWCNEKIFYYLLCWAEYDFIYYTENYLHYLYQIINLELGVK